jgi:hypothetical protein
MDIETLPCPECGEVITVVVTKAQWDELIKPRGERRPVLEVVPNMDLTIAERFITGYCGPCWDRIFAEESEEQEYKVVAEFKHFPVIEVEPRRKAMTLAWSDDSTERLHRFQAVVEGYIEICNLANDLVLIVNEEGLIRQMRWNARATAIASVWRDSLTMICGNAILAKRIRDELVPPSPYEAAALFHPWSIKVKWPKHIEDLMGVDGIESDTGKVYNKAKASDES